MPPGDIVDPRDVFASNPHDLGAGLFNPTTGQIRLGSFDRVSVGQGHQGLADALGIVNNDYWQDFLVGSSDPCPLEPFSTSWTERLTDWRQNHHRATDASYAGLLS